MKDLNFNLDDLPEEIRQQFTECKEEEYMLTERVPYLKFLQENKGRKPQDFLVAYYLKFGKKIDDKDLQEYKESYYNSKYSYTPEDIERAKTLQKEVKKEVSLTDTINSVEEVKKECKKAFKDLEVVNDPVVWKPISVKKKSSKKTESKKDNKTEDVVEPVKEPEKESPSVGTITEEHKEETDSTTLEETHVDCNLLLDPINSALDKIVDKLVEFINNKKQDSYSFRVTEMYKATFPTPFVELYKDPMYLTLLKGILFSQKAGQLKIRGSLCFINKDKYNEDKLKATMYKGLLLSETIDDERKRQLLLTINKDNLPWNNVSKKFFIRRQLFQELIEKLFNKPITHKDKNTLL